MKKHLQVLLLLATFLLPWVTQAQIQVSSSSPFNETFETSSTTRSSWTNSYVTGVWAWEYTNGVYVDCSVTAHGGSTNAAFINEGNGEVTKLVSPALQLTGQTSAKLSFWYCNPSWGFDIDGFAVFYRTSATGTWTQLMSTSAEHSSWTYQEYLIPLNATGYVQVAFQGTDGYGYGVGVDDVVVQVPPTCPNTGALVMDYLTSDTAIFHWHENGSATSWVVQYDSANFVPGTSVGTIETVTDTTYTMTNLTAGQTYYVYVHADCGGGDTSTNVSMHFTVPMSSASLPFADDFEGLSGWDFFSGSYSNGWMVGTAVNHGGTHSMYVSSDGTNNTYSINSAQFTYAVRNINITDTGEFAYTFDWMCNGESNYDYVRAFLAPGSATLTPAATSPNGSSSYSFREESVPGWISLGGKLNGTTTWNNQTGTFNLYTPGLYKLVFCWANDASGGSNPSGTIDNVMLKHNTCPRPATVSAENVSTVSADITWQPSGSESSWLVSYTQDTVEIEQVVNATTASLSGLTPNTPYIVKVYALCDAGDTSLATMVNFRTLCTAIDSLPYMQDFEAEATTTSSSPNSTFANCWYHLNNGTTYMGYPYIANSTTYNHTLGGSKGLYWYGSTTTGSYGDYYCVVLPAVDTTLHAINTLQLKFWAKVTGTSYIAPFQIGVMSDRADINTFQPVGTVTISGNTNWAEYLTSFATFAGNGQFVAIKAVRPTSLWYAYMDDITLEVAPLCPEVVNLNSAVATTTTFAVDWNIRGGIETPSGYEVELTEVDTLTGGTTLNFTTTDMNYAFSGLTAGTQYKVRVRAACSTGYGPWDSINVSTIALPCIAFDPTTLDTLIFSNNSSGVSGCLAYSSYGNTVYQTVYTASELTAAGLTAGPIIGIDLGFTACSSYAKEFTIFLGNSSVTSISDATVANPATHMQVYGPAAHPTNTSGWQHYNFDTPFTWDGSSSIMMTTFMNQPSGTSQSSSTGLTGYYTSASNKARYRYKDSNPFTLADINSGNAGTTYSYRASIHFYTGECTQVADCMPPTVVVDSADANNVYLSWLPGYQETSWDVDYRAGTTGSWINVTTGTSTTNAVVTGLSASTNYQFRVGSVCSDTTMYDVITYRTPCDFITVPYTEDFESYGSGTTAFPTCWYKRGTTADRPYINATTSYGHNNSHGLYFYAATSGYCYAIMPPTHHSMDSLQVSLWARQYSTSYNCSFAVGVMTDPDDLSTFVAVDTVHPATTTYEQFEVPLNRYTGTGRYIAFSSILNSGSGLYLMLDDVTLDYIPTCPKPTDLEATHVTSDSVTIVWSAGGSETEWIVSDDSTSYLVSDSTYTFTNLNPNTTYTFTVRAYCDASDTSRASQISVRTTCGLIASLPWFDGFEGLPAGSSSSAVYDVPCWARLDNASTYHFGYVGSISSWPTGAHTGTGFLYYYMPTTTGTYADWIYTILPEVDSSVYPINDLMVRFWTKMNSTTTAGDIVVGVITDITDPTTFTGVDTVHVAGSNWTMLEGMLGSYTGNQGRVALKMTRQPSVTTYYFLDDVTLQLIPDCPHVSNLHAAPVMGTEATIHWTENGDATSWEVEYGPQGFTRGTGTIATVSDDSLQITGLTPMTYYDVYVTPECLSGIGETLLLTFRTACASITTLPYIEDFESYGSGTTAFPTCWYKRGTTADRPYINATTSYGHNNSHGLYFYAASGGYCYAIMPPCDRGFDSLVVSFWARQYSTSYNCSFAVGVMTDPNDISTFVAVDTVHPATTNYEEFEVYLNGYTGTGRFIAFSSIMNTTSGNYMMLDDVTLDLIPDCPPVGDIHLAGIDSNMLSVAWTENGSATSWDIEYGVHGFTQGSGTTDVATSMPYVINGLTPNTQYDIYVKPVCTTGAGVTSFRMATFRTANNYVQLPFVCNFEDSSQYSLWTLQNGSLTNKWHIGTATNNGGTHSMYISNNNGVSNTYDVSSTAIVYAYADVMIPAPGDYSIAYDWKAYGESSIDWVRVALVPVSETPTAGTSLPSGLGNTSMPSGWIALDGGSYLNMQSSWQSFTRDVTLSSAGVYHLTFIWRNDASVGTTPPGAIDNVALARLVCPKPQNITASNLTTTSVDLSWQEVGTAAEWEYQLDNGTVTTAIDTNCSITGLTANTAHTFRVRSICGGGDTSFWATYNFRTPCGYISLPYTQDFESESTGSSTTGSAFVNCWTRLNNGTSYGGYPYVSSSSTYNHTTGGSKGFYWYNTTTTGTYGDYQCVVLPPVDTATPANTLQLSFWAKASSSSYTPVFKVGVMTDPNNINTFVPVDTITIPGLTTWVEYEIPLSRYTGNGNFVAVKADRPTSTWYAYVDDFRLDYIPTCPRPRDLHSTGNTSSSVSLDWTETGTATEWNVAVETSATTNPTGDTVVTAHPMTFNNLTAGINYHFYVRSICGVGDTSPWSDVCVCSPGSWTMRANQTDTLATCGAIIYDDGGPSGVYSMNQNSTLIVLPGSPNNLVSVSGSSYTESSFDYVTIYDGIGTSGTQLWTDNGISSLTSFGPFVSTNGPITITFHSDASVAYDGYQIQVSCITTHCRVLNVRLNQAVPESDQSLNVTWDDNNAQEYQVEYGLHGFTQGTGSMLSTYTNSIQITGLTALTQYDVYVRSICGVGDTGSWTMVTFSTAMCANATVTTTGAPSTTTYYAPVNNFYNYTLSETIIDSAELNGPQTIDAISYYYGYSSASIAKTDVDIYLQPTTKTTFSSSSDMVALNSTGVLVYSGSLNCQQGWNILLLDTVFDYSGTGNLLVIVDDNSGDYDGSDYVFGSVPCSGNKVIYYYSDSNNPSVTSPSGFSGNMSVAAWRPAMQLISCGAAGCRAPQVSVTATTYQDATISWVGTGNDYEVAVKPTIATTWPTETAVTGSSYIFSGLQPATSYMARVRQDCNADSLGYSDWTVVSFITDSMPCLAPTNLATTQVQGTQVTLGWTAGSSETAWDVEIFNATYDSLYTHVTNPATLGGLTPNVTYNAAVRALCGSAQNIEGAWSDTIQFTTQTCPNVTGLTTGNVTSNSVTLTWTTVGNAESYIVEYGYHDFSQGTGTEISGVTGNTYTVTGLESETQYDFYVKAVCGTGWISEGWSNRAQATTSQASGTQFTVDVSYNTTLGSVTINGNATSHYVVDEGQSVTLVATPNEHCLFVNWTEGGNVVSTNTTYTFTPTADVAFTANFQAVPQYTITANVNDPTMGTVTGAGTYYAGETCTLTATPNTDYYFKYWDDGNTDNPRSFIVTGNASYTATFSDDSTQVDTYTLTLNVNDPAMGVVVGAGTYAEGSEVLIKAIANQGYEFVTWSDGNTSANRTITITEDMTLTATFQAVQGIDDVNGSVSCTIFPNPTSSSATITVSGVNGQVRIQLIDMSGRTVASETMECSSDCVKTMDVNDLAMGTYFVRISGEQVNMVKKLIVR